MNDEASPLAEAHAVAGAELSGNTIVSFPRSHAPAASKGYKSGRRSWRETPEIRSTAKTRSGGTSSHCEIACLVTPSDAASLVSPPDFSIASFNAAPDIEAMSSMPSHSSQAPLHLQCKAELYHLDMTIGSLIKKARLAQKLSLESLGEKLGVSRQLVWQWEKGQSDPRKHIAGLSMHLKVPVEYFYGPKRSPSVLAAKIGQLSEIHQDLVETMVEKLLQQEQDDAVEKS